MALKAISTIDDEVSVAPIRKWHRDAPCRTATSISYDLWFPEDDERRAAPVIVKMCNRCPFKSDCLQDGMDYVDTSGIRGGTTKWQRDRLRDERNRVHCPLCGSDGVSTFGTAEICMSCGASWMVC